MPVRGWFAGREHHPRCPAAGGPRPVEPPAGGFAIDGNLLANTPTANLGDWLVNTNLAPGTGRGVLDANGVPLDPTRTFHFIDPYNDASNDRIFTGGDKWLDDPGTWGWTTGKPSAKTDINNVLLHLTTDTEWPRVGHPGRRPPQHGGRFLH